MKNIFLLILAFISSLFHNFFYNNYEKYDVYLLTDFESGGKYLQNIVRDFFNLFGWVLLCIYLFNTTVKRTIEGLLVRCLLVYSILDLMFYFIIYENTTHVKILLTITMILINYKEWFSKYKIWK